MIRGAGLFNRTHTDMGGGGLLVSLSTETCDNNGRVCVEGWLRAYARCDVLCLCVARAGETIGEER
jgi:hypothetical protein